MKTRTGLDHRRGVTQEENYHFRLGSAAGCPLEDPVALRDRLLTVFAFSPSISWIIIQLILLIVTYNGVSQRALQ